VSAVPAQPPSDLSPIPAPEQDVATQIPAPACLDSFTAPACTTAAECVQRGLREMKDTQSCGWSPCRSDEHCKLAFMSFLFACRADDARGCYELAQLHPYDSSKFTGQAPEPAALLRDQLHEKGCELGAGRSCYSMGERHHGTPLGDSWYERSVPLYEQACEKGEAEQCSLLAYNYGEARGVDLDRKKAVELFARACDLGDGYGCEHHGRALYDGKVVVKDRKLARSKFQRACELDPPYYGCYRLGKSHLLGAGGRANTNEAIRWFKVGCAEGAFHQDCNACNKLDSLCKKGHQSACLPDKDGC